MISGKLYAAIVAGVAAVIVVADYLRLGRGPPIWCSALLPWECGGSWWRRRTTMTGDGS
jgi:hypothetical protein